MNHTALNDWWWRVGQSSGGGGGGFGDLLVGELL